MPYANNKDADQPAHPHSLISVFVIRCLDGIIPLVSYLVSNPEDRFTPDVAQMCICSSQVGPNLSLKLPYMIYVVPHVA